MSEARLFAATRFTEIYERVLVAPLFRPFAQQLVARLEPRQGDRAIDVACGTGICARILRERLGPDAPIVGVDLAPAMLAVASTADPSIDWREGNATALPVGEAERFSLLTCHQGLQFVPDKAAAVSEMRRVLAPGGRLAVACWRSLQDTPLALALNAVAERHVGPITDSRHGFGDRGSLQQLVADGGFTDVVSDTLTHDVTFQDGALYARLNAMAVIGMSDAGKGLDEAQRGQLAERIAAESAEVIASASATGAFVIPMAANLVTGRA